MREDWTEPLTPAEKAQLEAIEEHIKNAPAVSMQAARDAAKDVLVKAEAWVLAKDWEEPPAEWGEAPDEEGAAKIAKALDDLYEAVQMLMGMKLYANEENQKEESSGS